MKANTRAFDANACWEQIKSIIHRGREKRLDLDNIARAVCEIEHVLDEHVLAEPDTRALAALKRIARRIPARHREARDVAFDIYDRATLFYSDDCKYLAHGGAAGLYEEMRMTLLNRLRALSTSR